MKQKTRRFKIGDCFYHRHDGPTIVWEIYSINELSNCYDVYQQNHPKIKSTTPFYCEENNEYKMIYYKRDIFNDQLKDIINERI